MREINGYSLDENKIGKLEGRLIISYRAGFDNTGFSFVYTLHDRIRRAFCTNCCEIPEIKRAVQDFFKKPVSREYTLEENIIAMCSRDRLKHKVSFTCPDILKYTTKRNGKLVCMCIETGEPSCGLNGEYYFTDAKGLQKLIPKRPFKYSNL
jgi:hypothetical protein